MTYKPRDPHALVVTVTERAGVVLIWTIGRDLLLRGLIAQASRPAGMNRIRLWTCQHHDWPSLMIAIYGRLAPDSFRNRPSSEFLCWSGRVPGAVAEGLVLFAGILGVPGAVQEHGGDERGGFLDAGLLLGG